MECLLPSCLILRIRLILNPQEKFIGIFLQKIRNICRKGKISTLMRDDKLTIHINLGKIVYCIKMQEKPLLFS